MIGTAMIGKNEDFMVNRGWLAIFQLPQIF